MTRSLTTPLVVTLAVAIAVIGCGGDPTPVRALPSGIPLPAGAEVKRHEREVVSLAASPDGRTLATVSGDSIHLWDSSSLRPLAVIDDVPLLEFNHGVAVADDGEAVAVLNELLELHVWEASTMVTRTVASPFGEGPRELVGFVGDGSLFYLTNDDTLVRWWSGLDAESTSEEDVVVDRRETISNVSFYATSRALGGERFLVWNRVPFVLRLDEDGRARSDALTQLENVYGTVRQAPYLTDERVLMVRDRDIEVVGVDGRGMETLRHDGGAVDRGRRDRIVASSLSPAGGYLAVAYRSGGVEIWNVDEMTRSAAFTVTGRFVRQVHDRRVRDLIFTSDALYVLLPEQRLLRYDPASWTLTGESEL